MTGVGVRSAIAPPRCFHEFVPLQFRMSTDTLNKVGRGLGHRGRRAAWTLACLIALLAASQRQSMAQIQPERLYYGVDRQIPVTVDTPEGSSGELEIRLYRSGADEPTERASVASGRVDLASLFPSIWDADDPTVLYAQLAAGGDNVGAPVVLQPMVSPTYFQPNPRNPRGAPVGRPMGDTYTGIRAYVDHNVVLETSAGEITFRLRPDHAPNTSWNFRHLAEGGFYTDVIFHRIIGPREGRPGFVVQGGDPTGTGTGGPGYFIDLEPSKLPHDFGVLSMARSGDPNSNGSQIFVCLSREGTHFLDDNYTAFAEAIDGAEAIRSLGATETGAQDRPLDPPVIEGARLVPASPIGQRPAPLSEASSGDQSDR